MRCAIVPLSQARAVVFACRSAAVATLAAGLCVTSAAQTKPAEPQAAPPAPAAAKPGDISKEALVFDKLYVRVREESDGAGTRQTTARVRVLADAGVKSMAVLAFTYTASSQQIDIAYVRVLKPDGSVVVTPDYNIQDMPAGVTREAPMYSDVHEKHVAVRGLAVGDTLEYQVTQRTTKPDVPGQFWLEYSFEKNLIVLDEQLDLDLPADKPVTVASADLQPTVTSASGRKLYHWASSNLARPDPDAPPKSARKWKPSVQATTFTSWEQVGAWYASLQKDRLAVTPAIQARAATLTKGLATDEDKLRAIFNDVALHIHYVGLDFGIGRYQPHPADDILSNEYGDCKDKHTLLAALLKAAGIEAWPVLISSGRYLDPATPSPGQFDHVITVAPLAGKLVWMDSTEEVVPVGVLAGTLRDKQALVVPINKPAYLDHTPADLPFPQISRFRVEGKLNDQGLFTGHFDETYRGDAETIFRAAFRSVPQSQWKEFIQGVLNFTGFAGEVKDPQVSAIEQTGEPIHFSFDYTREKFGDWDSHRITPPMPPMGNELAPGVKQIKPADDIDLGSPGENLLSTSVQIPEGWTLFPPQNVDLAEDWAEYHAKYAFADGTFTAERRLVVKKDKVPLADWDKYLDFRRAIFADESRMTPLSNPGEPEKWQSAFEYTLAPLIFGDTNPGKFSEESKKQIRGVLDSLRQATEILEKNPPVKAEDLAKASSLSHKAAGDVEAMSLALHAEDAHAVYWAELLSYAWSTLGWSSLESGDLPAAEPYLKAAWRLSHDRITGYQFGRFLEARGNKLAAAHQYQLAHITAVQHPLGGFLGSDYKVDEHLAASYRKLTGKELSATAAFSGGQYNNSLQAELDKETDIRPLTRTTKLTGSALYSVAFEEGKPVRVAFLGGDSGFASLVPVVRAHVFSPELPAGSKALLVREVRVICTPWGGCDAYLLLPTAVELPTRTITTDITPPNAPPGKKIVRTINVPLQP